MTLPGPLFAIGIISGIVGFFVWAGSAIIEIATAVAAALATVWATLAPILFAIWQSLGGIWSNVVKPAWDFVKAWGQRIWDLYTAHIKPFVDWFNGIVKAIRDAYRVFIQPILDILSVLDQFLRLTGLINTAFGSWLDGEIHRIDDAILQAWQALTKPINLLLHLVNEVILDARGILQAPLLLESTAHYMGYITQQWWETSLTTIKTDWGKVLKGFHTGPRIQTSLDAGRELVKAHGGFLAAPHDHGVAIFKLIAANDYQGFDYQAAGVGPETPTTTA